MHRMTELHDGGEPHRATEARTGGLRHATTVPARIEGRQGAFMNAEILDISSSGMFLRHAALTRARNDEGLPVGSRITVAFAPDHAAAPDELVRLAAKVVRSQRDSVGVRFVGLTPDQRRALRVLAVHAVERRAAPVRKALRSRGRPDLEIDARKVVSECRKVIERALPNVVWTLRAEVVQDLRAAAARDVTAITATAEADAIEVKGTAIGRTVGRRVLQRFAEVGGLDSTQELRVADIRRARAESEQVAEGPMGLVQNSAMDSTVALEGVCQRFDTELSAKSFNVNIRLANLLGRRIDNIENPLVPSVMCRMLWEAMTEHADSARVHAYMQRALVKHVMPLLSELYDRLDTTLDAQGVPESYWTHDDVDGRAAD